jgi:hypothetical protein
LLGNIAGRVSPFLKRLRSKVVLISNNEKSKKKTMKIRTQKVRTMTNRRGSNIVDKTLTGLNIKDKSKKMVLSVRSDKRKQHSLETSLPAINQVDKTRKNIETQNICTIDQIDRMFEELITAIKQYV